MKRVLALVTAVVALGCTSAPALAGGAQPDGQRSTRQHQGYTYNNGGERSTKSTWQSGAGGAAS